MNDKGTNGLQCPDCGSNMIQAEHIRYEPAFYFCVKCGMSKGTTNKRYFRPKAMVSTYKSESQPVSDRKS